MQIRKRTLAAFLVAASIFATACAAEAPRVASVLDAPVSAAQTPARNGFANLYYENVQQRYGDVIYAQGSDAQKMDLYLPAHAKKPYPVILAIHGGAWATGDKATGEVNPEMEALKYGFAVASINYRLSSEASFPAPLQDCKGRRPFLKSPSKKYKLEDDKIVAWGDSAGGNLAALLGTTAKGKKFRR
jgi:acetyl esterase/lipase